MDKPSRRFGICPPFYRWCLCGWYSQTKQPCWISMPWRVKGILQCELLAHPQDNHQKKKNLKQIPPKQLQVDALMYSCLIKRKRKKWSFWNHQVFIWRSALWYKTSVYRFCERFPVGVHKNQSDGQNCV